MSSSPIINALLAGTNVEIIPPVRYHILVPIPVQVPDTKGSFVVNVDLSSNKWVKFYTDLHATATIVSLSLSCPLPATAVTCNIIAAFAPSEGAADYTIYSAIGCLGAVQTSWRSAQTNVSTVPVTPVFPDGRNLSRSLKPASIGVFSPSLLIAFQECGGSDSLPAKADLGTLYATIVVECSGLGVRIPAFSSLA